MESMGAGAFMPLIMLVAMFGISYFLLIRPQKKKDKEATEMRNSLKIGDVVVTIGGIVGIVTSIKDDMLVLETGNDRNKVRVKKWAIQNIDSIDENTNKQ